MELNIYIELLKNKNLKVTQHRLEILRFLDKNRTHPSLEQVYSYIKEKFPSISKMTVYNVIDSLIENKIINSMRFVNSTELHVDFEIDTHFHFVCSKCGHIYDIDSELDLEKILKNGGHKADDYNVNIYGVCKKCLKK
ncbi:MAG: Fur family transcriptional regulator [Candidatus Delongbacteria bacterium]|nr:Fur family transcriptional regulator [Candidatus Delongbacteria bacterium]MDD4205735.1 Fur family transcriptional regulator [Candidatus Delongbacteria bacterium]